MSILCHLQTLHVWLDFLKDSFKHAAYAIRHRCWGITAVYTHRIWKQLFEVYLFNSFVMKFCWAAMHKNRTALKGFLGQGFATSQELMKAIYFCFVENIFLIIKMVIYSVLSLFPSLQENVGVSQEGLTVVYSPSGLYWDMWSAFVQWRVLLIEVHC